MYFLRIRRVVALLVDAGVVSGTAMVRYAYRALPGALRLLFELLANTVARLLGDQLDRVSFICSPMHHLRNKIAATRAGR